MITVMLTSGETELSFSPSSANIPLSGISGTLQHEELSASVTVPFSPEILKLTATKKNISVKITNDGETLFTGRLNNNQSWEDIGRPTPVDKINLTVADNTYLLDKKIEKTFSLKGTTLATVITRICQDCGVTIASPDSLPLTLLEIFVAQEGKKYKDVLNSLLFEHCLVYAFDGPGNFYLLDLSDSSDEEPEEITEGDLYSGVSVSQTTQDFDGAKVNYNPLTQKENQQIYFEGNSVGEDNKVVPIVLRPGQYWPYESDPVQEEREGQVFQTFENGYAESYQTYSGETKYRRSEKTTLIYSENHKLVQDWDEGITVNRTDFEPLQASVRFFNTTEEDKNLYQLAIRADAWYRNGDASVTAGDSSGSLYETDAEYIFTAEKAEKLAKVCSRFFCGRNFRISARTEKQILTGKNYRIDTGVSGTQFTALAVSCSYDPEEGVYSAEFLSFGDILVDVSRYKETAPGNRYDGIIGNIAQQVGGIISGSLDVGNPDPPRNVRAVADELGLSLSCSVSGVGIKNTVSQFNWEIFRGSNWLPLSSAEASAFYSFRRPEDGYPEAENLSGWQVRVKAVNIYGKQSEFSLVANIDTSTYGTWLLSQPDVTVRVSGRSVSFQMSQPQRADNRKVYGTIRHRIEIQKPSESDTWYKPATDKNPYESVDNWKDGEGFADTGDFYSQTLPLEGQDITVTEEGKKLSNPQDTLYRYRITPYSEASEGTPREVNATALGTNVQDIVHGSVTHEAISTPNLAAISANLGLISAGGFGTGSRNFWTLSELMAPEGKRYEGDFRVGGDNQFIRVEPVVNDREEVVDYKITIQVGSFQISSTASKINGEIIVQKDENSFDRTRITPYGTYYEYRPAIDSEWLTIAKQETRGLLSQLMYSDNTLVLTNADINERRRLGHDIGRPYLSDSSLIYHFDTNLLNQHQQTQCDITYDADPPSLVGREDNTDLIPIDFTPAILAVSPYSEVGKSLYGQYALTHPIGESNSWTVDFWLQYIWAERQVLFSIGTTSDKIQILNSTGEPNYNEPIAEEPPYNTETQLQAELPYNVALGADNWIQHIGVAQSEMQSLSELGVNFTANSWLHFAVVLSSDKITAYLNEIKLDFNRFSSATEPATVSLNETKNSFILDEFLIDPVTAETLEDFAATTNNKVPFGSLDWRQQWFIVDAHDTHNLRTNLFDSEAFASAVKKIIQETSHD